MDLRRGRERDWGGGRGERGWERTEGEKVVEGDKRGRKGEEG